MQNPELLQQNISENIRTLYHHPPIFRNKLEIKTGQMTVEVVYFGENSS